MQAPASSNVVRFGPFQLDLKAGELHRDSGPSIRLQEQPFKVLKLLLEHPGEVVTRDEMRRRLWPNDTVVEFDQSINAAIKKLRGALEDSAENPRYVETVARRGYRLMVPVELAEPPREEVSVQKGNIQDQVKSAGGSLLGKRLGQYRVLQVIGGGGMGVVYAAEDLKLGRRVALKFLPEELGKDAKALDRFEREARAASALDHPNICPIYEFREHEGQPFMVLPLLEGRTLRDRMAASSVFSTEELLTLAIQITDGLASAHSKGIIHRDIKPANIFLTQRGEAKILDFGLAKLTHLADTESEPTRGPASEMTNLNLTMTGVALGTAAYMSPEQVRGEKLDARTDLFSLGLVLYEMATGRQAFSGDTAAIVQAGILHRTPVPTRQLNSKISPKLEQVINRALEKSRERRYQSAADMCSDLKRLQRTPEGTFLQRRRVLMAALTVLLLVGAAAWFFRRQPSSTVVVPELKQRQVTNNSSEKAVLSGSISPDGKYMAYSDMQGIHVKLIDTGETADLPPPDSLRGADVTWGIVPTWLQDGSHFIANAQITGQSRSIWAIPVFNGVPRKLRDDATAVAVARTGAWVAFTTNVNRIGLDREMWLMNPDGGEARKLFELEPDSFILGAESSPDGRRLAYMKHQETPDWMENTLESRDLRGELAALIVKEMYMRDYSWFPDGRMIYCLSEPGPLEETCNYWAIQVDPLTGRPKQQRQRLTNWAGFCMDNTSATADGKRLAFRKHSMEGSVYVADIEASGTRISTPKRLTLDEGRDFTSAWTADSKAIVFSSYRDGQWGIFKQPVDGDRAQAITLRAADYDESAFPRLSPDGRWVLYLARSSHNPPSGQNQVMRSPIAGGSPELVMDARSVGGPTCARYPATFCVIAEPTADRKKLVFTAFDPMKGRGRELLRFDTDPVAPAYVWDLSPDGSLIAILRYSEGRIHIIHVASGQSEEVVAKGWNGFLSVNWAVDGKGWFVSALTSDGSALLRVDPKGKAHVLWKEIGSAPNEPASGGWIGGPHASWAVPSPDGRHLAINNRKLSANMWMIENF